MGIPLRLELLRTAGLVELGSADWSIGQKFVDYSPKFICIKVYRETVFRNYPLSSPFVVTQGTWLQKNRVNSASKENCVRIWTQDKRKTS